MLPPWFDAPDGITQLDADEPVRPPALYVLDARPGQRNNPPQRPEWNGPLFREPGRADPAPEAREGNRVRDPPPGLLGKVMVLLGYAGPDARVRSALVSLVCSQLWWLAQVRPV